MSRIKFSNFFNLGDFSLNFNSEKWKKERKGKAKWYIPSREHLLQSKQSIASNFEFCAKKWTEPDAVIKLILWKGQTFEALLRLNFV